MTRWGTQLIFINFYLLINFVLITFTTQDVCKTIKINLSGYENNIIILLYWLDGGM